MDFKALKILPTEEFSPYTRKQRKHRRLIPQGDARDVVDMATRRLMRLSRRVFSLALWLSGGEELGDP